MCRALGAFSGFYFFYFFARVFCFLNRFFSGFFYVLVFCRSSLAFQSKNLKKKTFLREKRVFFFFPSRESHSFTFARGTVLLRESHAVPLENQKNAFSVFVFFRESHGFASATGTLVLSRESRPCLSETKRKTCFLFFFFRESHGFASARVAALMRPECGASLAAASLGRQGGAPRAAAPPPPVKGVQAHFALPPRRLLVVVIPKHHDVAGVCRPGAAPAGQAQRRALIPVRRLRRPLPHIVADPDLAYA